MLSPIVIMIIMLNFMHYYTASLIIYNTITLLLIPTIYSKLNSKNTSDYLLNKMNNIEEQIYVGLFVGFIIFTGILVNYYMVMQF